MKPFEDAPEFVDLDNRQFRQFNPVSKEQMQNKHEVLLPPEVVKGKTVLDLGSCMGGTGHWALSHGAAHYTGVELQESYITTCQPLFEKYHPGKYSLHVASAEDWLAKDTQTYDIVCMLGLLFVFVDYYSVIKRATELARETIVIDSLYHDRLKLGDDFVGVQFRTQQTVNLADEHASLVGRGASLSPQGLQFVMGGFGFVSDGVLHPKPITSHMDIYHLPPEHKVPNRYLMRFTRAGAGEKSLSEHLATDKKGLKIGWGGTI